MQGIEAEKRYRLGYDYVFIPNKAFNYKGDYIGSMAIFLIFKIIDKTNNEEIVFTSSELEDQKLQFQNGSFYISELVNCLFDRNEIFRIEPKTQLLDLIGAKIKIEWKVDSYSKGLGDVFQEGALISEDEFKDIMKNNLDTFDNSDNYPTQTCAYITEEIKNI